MVFLTARRKRGLLWVFVALFIIATLSAALIYLPQFAKTASIYNPTAVLPAGTSNCPGVGTYAVGSQPGNCLIVPMNLQIHLQNLVTSAALSGWTCQVLWGTGNTVVAGTSPGPAGQIAETVANTASNGNCVTSANFYYAGWQLNLKICHQTTACTTSSYAQQEYVAILPLPGGTVPFYTGTQAPTSTWTQQFTVLVTPMAGDLAASNTPITLTKFTLPNGTSIATGTTCFLNEAKGTHSCYLGAGVFSGQISVTLQNTYSTSTYPYVAGYTDFNGNQDPIEPPNIGQLSTNLQQEVKQTSGSDPIPVISGGGSYGFSNGPYTKAASVPDQIYATPSLSTILTINQQNGYTTPNPPGTVTIVFQFNAQGMSTSSDQATLTFNLYAYYSVSWVAANGGTLNTATAVTQMSQYVLTLQTH